MRPMRGGKEGVINLVQKQTIIIKHREGVSNRKIAADLGIDKNTVNTYVNEYERELRELLASNPEIDEAELPPGRQGKKLWLLS